MDRPRLQAVQRGLPEAVGGLKRELDLPAGSAGLTEAAQDPWAGIVKRVLSTFKCYGIPPPGYVRLWGALANCTVVPLRNRSARLASSPWRIT